MDVRVLKSYIYRCKEAGVAPTVIGLKKYKKKLHNRIGFNLQ